MDVKRMHEMIEKLSECAKTQFEKGIDHVDTCEMGKVIDMMKDLSEAMYYRTLTKAMEDSDSDEVLEMFERYGDGGKRFYDHYRYADGRFAPKGHGTYRRGYEEPPYYHMTPEMYRDMDRDMGRMYYTEPTMNTSMRDSREGRSGMSRRAYMENKELHKANTTADKEAKVRDLNTYMTELATDMSEIINDATPEEKSVLKSKLSALVTKIG
nr:MAG TPA: hypothetical protein [Bacteriophage sp.]